MIELPNGNIALSSYNKPYPIAIIDCSSYQVISVIQLEGYITHNSVLCVFDQHSFIYVYKGAFLQISIEDGSVLFQSNEGNFHGMFCIIPIERGKYFAIENKKCISIVKPYYI